MSDSNGDSGSDLEKLRANYSTGIQIQSVSDFGPDEVVQLIGELIDAAGILQEEDGLEHALDLADRVFGKKDLEDNQEARLYYFVGNAHSELYQLDNINSRILCNWRSARSSI